MSIKTEWNKFINKIMWLWIWDSSTRKELRAPLSQLIYGKNNNIILLSTDDIPKEGRKASNITGLNIYIKGDNNTIKIADNTKFNCSNISIWANNATVIIGKNSNFTGLNINICNGNNQKITLGDNIRTGGVIVNLNETNAQLTVKDNCLFSGSISIWPTDGHSIFDKDTKKRINNITRAIEIGEHCWIGEGVKLAKNAKLAPNTVVGIGSVVTKPFNETNTIIAGNPAKVIKKNILWEDSPYYKFD